MIIVARKDRLPLYTIDVCLLSLHYLSDQLYCYKMHTFRHPILTSSLSFIPPETGAKKKHRIRDGFSAIRRKIFGSSASRTRASSPPGEEPPRKCKSTGNVLSDEYSRLDCSHWSVHHLDLVCSHSIGRFTPST